jgi:hypothetical protein
MHYKFQPISSMNFIVFLSIKVEVLVRYFEGLKVRSSANIKQVMSALFGVR